MCEDLSIKAEYAVKMVCEEVLLAYVLKGGENIGEVSDFARRSLKLQGAEQEEGAGANLRAKCPADLAAVLKTLLVLADPDPQRCSVIASHKVVNATMAYRGENSSIEVVMDATGQSELWSRRKTECA